MIYHSPDCNRHVGGDCVCPRDGKWPPHVEEVLNGRPTVRATIDAAVAEAYKRGRADGAGNALAAVVARGEY